MFSWLRKQHRLRDITDGHLLRNMFWKPLNPNAMTSYLAKRCECHYPCCQGKKMGCCLLRHIVISWRKRNELTLADRAKLAADCMHSPAQQELYRVTDAE